ncbi:MAG: LemA family protein [Acidimicrobiia bacterium]
MNTALVVVASVVMLALLWFGLAYNRFVQQRNLVANSWHNIDTELQRRYDLIPNLVETVKGYAKHEQAVFEAVTAARTKAMATTGPADRQAPPERELVGGLRQLFAVAEGYPDLKASEQFLELQHQLVDTEDRLQVARRIYNANVRGYNTRIESVPSNLIASMFHFTQAPYFEVEESLRSAPPPPVDLRERP